MMIADLISENPYSPSPRGYLGDFEIIGREEITIDIWDMVYRASQKRFIPSIIRAPYGGGKTTYLRWLNETLKEKQNYPSYVKNKNLLIVYTKLSHPSIKAIVDDFLNILKIQLSDVQREPFLKNLDRIKKKLDETDINKNDYYYSILYRNVIDFLYSQNADVIVHIIDEFEAISEIPAEQSRGFLHEFRDFIDEIEERSILLILGCTDEAYRLMEEIHPALVSRVPEDFKKDIVSKLSFTLENTLDFVSKRLESTRIKNPDDKNPYFPFSRKSIELLYNRSGGNIRTMEQTCYFALEKSMKDNVGIDDKLILTSMHKVLTDKRGLEKKASIYNLIDDPKEKESFINLIQGGDPTNLKKGLFEGFKEFLSKQNFDYQFQHQNDIFNENVSIVKIYTHAYRTIPISIAYFCSTIPKDLGHSDFIDAEKIRTYFNASLCIILRIVETEKSIERKDNVLEICIPLNKFEEFSILSYITNIDKNRISRSLEDDFKILFHINHWIKIKNEEGTIIGNRFKQYEISIYNTLWRMGNDYNSIDEIYQYSKNLNKKYSKTTLIARLKTLEDKKLVICKDYKYALSISPLMERIYKLIIDQFENNPIMPLDLMRHFMGGSTEMLRRYMQIMSYIGILETIKIGRSTAYKIMYSMEDVKQYDKNKKEINLFLSENTDLPLELKNIIIQFDMELKNSYEYIKNQSTLDLKLLINLHRINSIFKEIKEYVLDLNQKSLELNNEYEQIILNIDKIKTLIKTCEKSTLNVDVYNNKYMEISNHVNKLYEIDYKQKGRIDEVILEIQNHQIEINKIHGHIVNILESYGKLISDIKASEKIVHSIKYLDNIHEVDDNLINDFSANLEGAKESLKNREFTMTEFHLLKILQNSFITKQIYNYNLRVSEHDIEVRELYEMSKISAKFNPVADHIIDLQFAESSLKKVKLDLSNYDFLAVNQALDDVGKKTEIIRTDTIKNIISWFSEILDPNKSLTAYEISKHWNLPLETVLQATLIMMRHNKIGIVWGNEQ